jgi:hypothetical protein
MAEANRKKVQRGDTTPTHIAANEPRIRIAPAVRAIGASMKRRPGVTHGSPVAR